MHYQSNTGLKQNFEKSLVYRIGTLKDTGVIVQTSQKFRWMNDLINILGIDVCADHNTMVWKNYKGIVEKSKDILKDWKNRVVKHFR